MTLNNFERKSANHFSYYLKCIPALSVEKCNFALDDFEYSLFEINNERYISFETTKDNCTTVISTIY